jgi:AcrR family transcriptional regulator
MPPKTTFTRDMFIEAAFRVVRKEGIGKLSARSLARELNCSTMPIYSYLKSMRNLREDLQKKAVDLLLSYQNTPRSGMPFYDMGLGYVLFARNEKNLFRFIFTDASRGLKKRKTGINLQRFALDSLIDNMKFDPQLEGVDGRQAENIMVKMWIFVHGIAFLLNTNQMPDDSEDYINQLIYETGKFVIEGETGKKLNAGN